MMRNTEEGILFIKTQQCGTRIPREMQGQL